MKQLSKFFCNLSRALNSQHALNDVAIPELGIELGTSFQQIIYNALFPIYFRKNWKLEEIKNLTLWQILCEGTLPLDFDIAKLARDCHLNLASEIKLNTNTRAFIATKSSAD